MLPRCACTSDSNRLAVHLSERGRSLKGGKDPLQAFLVYNISASSRIAIESDIPWPLPHLGSLNGFLEIVSIVSYIER